MNGWKILSSYSKPLKMVGYSIFTLYLFRRSVSIPCIHECVRVCVFVFWKKQQHNARHWKLTTFSLYETDVWTVARVRALYARRECVLNSTLNICFQHIRTCFLSSFSCHNVCQVSFFTLNVCFCVDISKYVQRSIFHWMIRFFWNSRSKSSKFSISLRYIAINLWFRDTEKGHDYKL